MTGKAICFKCGSEKSGPLKLCGLCHAIPEDPDDKLVSMCMSSACIKESNLEKVSKYIRKKNRIPNFKERVIQKATELLKLHDVDLEESQDLDFSTSYFDFQPDADIANADRPGTKSSDLIKVHIIGRPPGITDDVISVALEHHAKTSHHAFWTIGKDITRADYDANRDSDGGIYVRYRLMGTDWNREFISGALYGQLKALEDGAF